MYISSVSALLSWSELAWGGAAKPLRLSSMKSEALSSDGWCVRLRGSSVSKKCLYSLDTSTPTKISYVIKHAQSTKNTEIQEFNLSRILLLRGEIPPDKGKLPNFSARDMLSYTYAKQACHGWLPKLHTRFLSQAVWAPPITPNPPPSIAPTNIAWVKLYGKFPVGLGITPLKIKTMLEPKPLKSIMLARRLTVFAITNDA